MRVNREREMMDDTVARARKIGKGIYAVFLAATILSILVACANLLGSIMGVSSGDAEALHTGGFLYSLVQSVVMSVAYLLCTLVARDASRGETLS